MIRTFAVSVVLMTISCLQNLFVNCQITPLKLDPPIWSEIERHIPRPQYIKFSLSNGSRKAQVCSLYKVATGACSLQNEAA